MNTTQFIHQIRDYIGQNKLETALLQLRLLLENSTRLDEVLHQSARFEAIRQEIRLGKVSHEEATLTENQIRTGLLDLLRELETQVDTGTLRKEVEQAVSIVHSKNAGANSNISVRGDVHVDHKNFNQNAEKIYNIDNIDQANFS